MVAALCLAAVVAVGAAAAVAGSCRVLVALGSVEIEPSPAGLSLRVSGNWEFDNLIQVVSGLSFNVLLVRDHNFVRLSYPDKAFSGAVDGLAGKVDAGLNGDDILEVEAAGQNDPTARFVSLEAQRLKVTSPVPPGSGPISVLAYLVLDGDYVSPIISNTITRPLEAPATLTGEDDTAPSGDTPAPSGEPASGEPPSDAPSGEAPSGVTP